MSKKLLVLLSMAILSAMILAACQPAAPAAEEAAPAAEEAAPAAEEAAPVAEENLPRKFIWQWPCTTISLTLCR